MVYIAHGSSANEPRTWSPAESFMDPKFSIYKNLFSRLAEYYNVGARHFMIHLPFARKKIDGKAVWPMDFDAAVEVSEEIKQGMWNKAAHPRYFEHYLREFLLDYPDTSVVCYLGSIKFDADLIERKTAGSIEGWYDRCWESVKYIIGACDQVERSRVGVFFDHIGAHAVEDDPGYHFQRMLRGLGHETAIEPHPKDEDTQMGGVREFLMKNDNFAVTEEHWYRAWLKYETRSRIQGKIHLLFGTKYKDEKERSVRYDRAFSDPNVDVIWANQFDFEWVNNKYSTHNPEESDLSG